MEESRKIYGDIIDRPHHVSGKRPQMSRINRAAQFSPFAALTGYDDLVRESARSTDEKMESTEYDMSVLDAKLRLIQDNLSDSPVISAVYFVPDPFKRGGKYMESVGRVKKIRSLEQVLILEDGSEIEFGDIISLSGEIFKDFNGSSQLVVD